ncbi:MAG: hypothetical protein M0P69_08220 [Bacteroidales bacterium]|nr:hypothetical protein [Bacteroidales bacterium]
MNPFLRAVQGLNHPSQTAQASAYTQQPQGRRGQIPFNGGVRYPPRHSLGSYQGPPQNEQIPFTPPQNEQIPFNGGVRHPPRPPQDKQIPFNNPQRQLDPSVASKLSFDDLMYLVQLNDGQIMPGSDGSYRMPENFGGGPGNFNFEDLMALTMWMQKFQ